MEKKIIILCLLLVPFLALGQDKEKVESRDVVQAKQLYGGLGFSVGLMTEKTQNLFVQGDLGYFLHKNVSIRADAYYFVNSIGDRPRFKMNHQIFFGGDFHWPLKFGLTPHVGIQPGIAISQSSEYTTLNIETGEQYAKITVNPLISTVFGLTYHAPKYFYAYIEGRYLLGIHSADTYPTHLDEIRFQFGLGWFVNFKK